MRQKIKSGGISYKNPKKYIVTLKTIYKLANILCEISACESVEGGKKAIEYLLSSKRSFLLHYTPNKTLYLTGTRNNKNEKCCRIYDEKGYRMRESLKKYFTGGFGFSGSNGGPIGKLEKVSYRGKEK